MPKPWQGVPIMGEIDRCGRALLPVSLWVKVWKVVSRAKTRRKLIECLEVFSLIHQDIVSDEYDVDTIIRRLKRGDLSINSKKPHAKIKARHHIRVKIDFLPCNTDVLSKRRDIEQEVSRQGHVVTHDMVNSDPERNQERTVRITKADLRFPHASTCEADPALQDQLGLVVRVRNRPPIFALYREPKQKIVARTGILD